MGRRRLAKALAAGALLLACCAALTHGSSEQQRRQAEERLFQQLDANKVRLGAACRPQQAPCGLIGRGMSADHVTRTGDPATPTPGRRHPSAVHARLPQPRPTPPARCRRMAR